MNQLEKELQRITKEVSKMWALVEFQVINGREALLNADHQLARKVEKRGKKVNNCDIKIDRMVENFFAIYNPVAVDLRWALAILKINSNLERIGDSADSISKMVQEMETAAPAELIKVTRLEEMYSAAIEMLQEIHTAFDNKDTKAAIQVIRKDKLLNNIWRNTDAILIEYIQKNPQDLAAALKVSGFLRKLERIGDQVTNIAEEIIFYVDAKVVKHIKVKKLGEE